MTRFRNALRGDSAYFDQVVSSEGYTPQGDPFWGALIGGAIGLGKKIVKAARSSSKVKQVVEATVAGGGVVGAIEVARGIYKGTRSKTVQTPMTMDMVPVSGCGAKGYHMSKPRSCGGMVIPSHPVRNRRMRVTNPRALKRALRRARGFEKLARRVIKISAKFKKPKKRVI
jgi:hypothetical protein